MTEECLAAGSCGAGRKISSMSEIPVHLRPRRLADWLNPDGQRKVHSLVDKGYQPKNRRAAWEKVKANRGSGGVDGQSVVLGTRPTRVARILALPPGRSRAPASPGVAEAEQAIMDELGLS